MGTVGLARKADFTAHINLRGAPTLVNGQTINALWEAASVGHVQTYIAEQEWKQPVYEVKFPAAVLNAPYNLKEGVNVYKRGKTDKGAVRRLFPEESDGEIVQVSCLVVLAPR